MREDRGRTLLRLEEAAVGDGILWIEVVIRLVVLQETRKKK